MLDGRHWALAGLAAVAFGVAAVAFGCANGTPDDAATVGDDDGGGGGGGETGVPQDDSGVTPPTGDAGCHQTSDCPTGTVCDTGSGLCVGCNGDGDCPAGSLCNAGTKTCAPGCNPNHLCPAGKACCNGTCATTNTITACTGCGLACDTSHSTGPSCDGKTCAYTGCGVGFGDCKTTAPNLDGCETPINTPTDCGGCGRACATTNVAGTPTCAAGACTSACVAGYANCKQPVGAGDGGVPDDGCETKQHSNGLGQFYTDCPTPLGTPGDDTTYTKAMATEAAAASVIGGSFIPGGNCTISGFVFACPGQQSATTCAVWCVEGPYAGHVHQAASCACPSTSDPSWN